MLQRLSGLLDSVHGNHGDEKMGRTFTEEEVDWAWVDTQLKGKCGRMFAVTNATDKYVMCYRLAATVVPENHDLNTSSPLPICAACLADVAETLQKYSLLYTVTEDGLIKRFEGIRYRCPPEDRSMPAWTIPTTRAQRENQDQ
jgi:hypothetical protein